MFVKVYNQSGEETGKTLLPKGVFDVKLNSDLLWQVARSQSANKRQGSAHTKTKGEVRGGGRKPWRQKGTGRSRHSSIRSPLWRGGGVIFGPRNDKVWKQKINKKMARKAVLMALSTKARQGDLIVLESLNISGPKTREVSKIISDLRGRIADFHKGKVLVVLPVLDKNFIRASRNIPGLETVGLGNLSALKILSFKYLLATKESISAFKRAFSKKDEAE
ncbi:MAG: 50S ribosomal protein L4 [bacterium]|nr:50S ribosomal protein L4 [bacterium]